MRVPRGAGGPDDGGADRSDGAPHPHPSPDLRSPSSGDVRPDGGRATAPAATVAPRDDGGPAVGRERPPGATVAPGPGAPGAAVPPVADGSDGGPEPLSRPLGTDRMVIREHRSRRDPDGEGPGRSDLAELHRDHYAKTVAERECGTAPVPQVAGGTGRVEVRCGEGEAWFAGLRRCGSWRCPICAPWRAREAAREIREALEIHREDGGGSCMVTLTLPHHGGDGLEDLLDVVQDAWSYATSDVQAWDRIRERYGISTLLKTREVTWGSENGWHPHVHAILLADSPLSDDAVQEIEDHLYQRWARRIERKHGRDRPSRRRGVQVDAADGGAGEYVAKMGLGREMSRMDVKEAKGGNLTPFQMLAELHRRQGHPLEGPRGVLHRAYAEYCRVTAGRHLMDWSPTDRAQELRDRAAARIEDDDTPEETPEDQGERVCDLSPSVFRCVRGVEGGERRVKRAAARDGWEGVKAAFREIERKMYKAGEGYGRIVFSDRSRVVRLEIGMHPPWADGERAA